MNVDKGAPSAGVEAAEGPLVPMPPLPMAWVIAFGRLGLINIVAESQKELVEQITDARVSMSHFVEFTCVSNAPPYDTSEIFLDPDQIEAVLDQWEPRPRGGNGAGRLPAGIQELVDRMRDAARAGKDAPPAPNGGTDDEPEVVVVVEPANGNGQS